jgi:hypothetical protein
MRPPHDTGATMVKRQPMPSAMQKCVAPHQRSRATVTLLPPPQGRTHNATTVTDNEMPLPLPRSCALLVLSVYGRELIYMYPIYYIYILLFIICVVKGNNGKQKEK